MVAWGAIIGAVASAMSSAKQAEEGGTRSKSSLVAPSNNFSLGVVANPVWALNIGGGHQDPAIGPGNASPIVTSSATPFQTTSASGGFPSSGGSPGAFPVGVNTLPGPAAGGGIEKMLSDPVVLGISAVAVGLYLFMGKGKK